MDAVFSLEKMGAITDLASGERWSADRIRQEVAGRCSPLREAGVTRGTTVILAHGGSLNFFADLFSIWKLGGCAVCLNSTLTRNELVNVASFVKPQLILHSADQDEKTRGLTVPCMDLLACSGPDEELPTAAAAGIDDPALILFTSGTTGDPKGVVHTFRTLSDRLHNNREHLSDEILARTLCVLPTHFGHGLIGNCLTPLSSGQELFLLQNPGVAGAARLADVLAEHQITFMSSVPSFWKIVLKVSSPPTSGTLRQVSVGSAPLSRELWLQIMEWACTDKVCNMYGITETANWTAGASGAEVAPENGLVGKMWGGEASVYNAEGRRAATGEGEILLRPPSLMVEYLMRPDLTDEVIKDGWYHTGDWGSIDDQGTIRLLGRTKTEINKAGIKILPEEIDLLLEEHDLILEACAFGIPDPISGETVAAAICFKDGEEVEIADLRAWCAERIRPDGIPDKWYVMAQIPKTDRGKVNRQIVHDACMSME